MMDNNEEKKIHISIGATYLDGTGERIYASSNTVTAPSINVALNHLQRLVTNNIEDEELTDIQRINISFELEGKVKPKEPVTEKRDLYAELHLLG